MPVQVLVIEDNATNLELMTYLLKAFGYETLGAFNGEEGLDLVRRSSPDLIICDIGLPKMDGYAVAEYLKNHSVLRSIPLVAVTALAMVGDREKALAAGFDGYIPKPIDPGTFVNQVEQFLRPEQRIGARAPIPSPSTETPERLIQQNATILVVDNVEANLDLMQSILAPFGYRVLTTNNVSDALKLATQHHPDLIITDLHMPGMNGFDLLVAVKTNPNLKSTLVCILSATVMSKQDAERARALGVDKFVTRPLEPQMLLQEIASLLQSER